MTRRQPGSVGADQPAGRLPLPTSVCVKNEGISELINPILRGWTNYFRIGQSSRCFSHVKDWVEKKVRRHLMRQRGRLGFGWKRWSRQKLYDRLGLFSEYRVVYLPKALPV